jgi:hypothetical protein
MFGGTPGAVHMNKDGVEFVYFNHGSKAFERVKISPAHAHMVIPSSCSTSEIGSTADARDACAVCPTTTVNANATCLNPS